MPSSPAEVEEEETINVAPAMFGHCVNTYAEMFRRSNRLVVDGETSMVVYEGMFTKLITEVLELPVPYYTAVRKWLTAMGCIRQLRRGGNTSPSQWELIREPEIAMWNKVYGEEPITGPTPTEQAIADINRRLQRVEKVMGLDVVPMPIGDDSE